MLLTYFKCQSMIGKKNKKKLCYKTYLYYYKEEDVFAVRHHNTDILTINRNDWFTYNNGGWYSVTTKSRLNDYGPIRIYQSDFIWYVYSRDHSFEYENGMIFDKEGNRVLKERG